jgi:hypothetical protein
MTLSRSQGAGIVIRTSRNRKTRGNPGEVLTAAGPFSPTFVEEDDPGVPDQFAEKVRLTGIDFGPEDTYEIKVLEQFLGRHVQVNKICDVQCMLLWNEWIRTFQRRTPGFPKRIREKEFRSVVIETFDTGIALDGFRGAVYPGIKFVP